MAYVSKNMQTDGLLVKINADRLDAANGPDVKSEILASVASTNGDRLIIDMSPITFIDSSGLGALVSVKKNIPENYNVELINTSDFVQKVLRLTKMDRVFTI